MDETTAQRDIADAIMTRRFQLDHGHVDIYVWAPVVPRDDYVRCDFQIVGLGDGRIRVGEGLDTVGAVHEALKVIAIMLYASKEWREGRLTRDGMRDLDLPYLPGQRPLQDGLGAAHLLHMSSWLAVVAMPDVAMPYIAWADWSLPTHIKNLETALADLETSPENAKSLLGEIITGLHDQKHYYDRVCRDAGLPPSSESL
jgi:hypothetical protein